MINTICIEYSSLAVRIRQNNFPRWIRVTLELPNTILPVLSIARHLSGHHEEQTVDESHSDTQTRGGILVLQRHSQFADRNAPAIPISS